MNKKKYIGDRAFYKMVMAVAVPIMLQNFITNFVNMLDNIMVGSVGTEQMAAVSIVNQLIFVFNLSIFGAVSGAGIFTSQFYGKKDDDGVRYTLRYKMIFALVLTIAAIFLFSVFDENFIKLYLHEAKEVSDLAATLGFAKQYLKIIVWGLLPFAVANVFASTLRETEQTIAPMLAGIISVFINVLFNWILIFGHFGFPAMGVRGAALATVIARAVECIFIILYVIFKRKKYSYFKQSFSSLYIPARLFGQITLKGMPILFNEFIWSLGMSLLAVAYSLHGLDVVAGYSISSTAANLFWIAFITLGSSIGIIVGKHLGAGEFEEAENAAWRLIFFSLALSLVMMVLVYFVGDKITLLYKTNEASKAYAGYFIKTCALFMPFVSFTNASYFTLRAGGKTLATFMFDSVFMLVVTVPVAFVLSKLAHLSIFIVYPAVQAMDIIKSVIGFILLKSKIWIRNIVNE